MRYGLPYKGSKNAIAEWVLEQLPRLSDGQKHLYRQNFAKQLTLEDI
jgi:hypothetical protein